MFGRTMVRGSIMGQLRLWGGILILLGVVTADVQAQTLTTLASFKAGTAQNAGIWLPGAGLIVSGNTLYGTTCSGTVNSIYSGTVFSVPLSGGSVTTLASVNGYPSGLTLSGNALYGTTEYGGLWVGLGLQRPTKWQECHDAGLVYATRRRALLALDGPPDRQRQHTLWDERWGRRLLG